MVNDSDFKKALELIKQSNNCLITTHTRPDGDACGCCIAVAETFAEQKKNTKLLLLSELPEWYRFLFKTKPLILGDDLTADQLKSGSLGSFDLIIIVDTNSKSQLPDFDELLKNTGIPVLVIDHHQTSDGLGDVELIDTTASAASLIVLDLFKFANWPITPSIAQVLFTGIATDTGWFHFSNTDSRTFQGCAELIGAGAEPAKIYHSVYQNYTVARFNLMLAMLNSLELHLAGRYACQHITRKDFERTGAKYEDTENLIDECRRIKSVEVAALFVESGDGKIKCSLRSGGPVDVCKIAQSLGGGGHTAAAGVFLPGPLENAEKTILDAVEKQFA